MANMILVNQILPLEIFNIIQINQPAAEIFHFGRAINQATLGNVPLTPFRIALRWANMYCDGTYAWTPSPHEWYDTSSNKMAAYYMGFVDEQDVLALLLTHKHDRIYNRPMLQKSARFTIKIRGLDEEHAGDNS